jgi:hypothetical protein
MATVSGICQIWRPWRAGAIRLFFAFTIFFFAWAGYAEDASAQAPSISETVPASPMQGITLDQPSGESLARTAQQEPPPGLVLASAHGAFTVFAEAGVAETARDLAIHANGYLERIAADLPGLPVPTTIQIRVVRDASALNKVAPENRSAPGYAIGVAYPDLGIISIALQQNGNLVSPDETLRHELAHLAIGAAIGPKVPRWLHEGFAYQHAGEWTWERAETLAAMAWGGNIKPLDELESGFPAAEMPASNAYAQSYDFVGFLSRRGRWDDTSDDGDRWAFRRFLGQFAQTKDIDKAAMAAFGRPMHALFDEWQQNLRERYVFVPAGVFASGLWIIAALLLVLAYIRRRRLNRIRLALWDEQERQADAARQAEAARQQAERERWLAEHFASALPEQIN